MIIGGFLFPVIHQFCRITGIGVTLWTELVEVAAKDFLGHGTPINLEVADAQPDSQIRSVSPVACYIDKRTELEVM